MPGGVDKIEDVIFTIIIVYHPDSVRFDGDAFFALQIHAVQKLRHFCAFADHMSRLQKAICQGRFAVVDMRDYAEIPDVFLIHAMSFVCLTSIVMY
jgi:hypothetical protein